MPCDTPGPRSRRSKRSGSAIRREDFSYAAGRHCRWCPAAGVCPHLAAVARDAAAAEIAAPELIAAGELGAQQLDEALLLAEPLEHRIRATWQVAEAYLMAGGKLPNHKLVKTKAGLTVVPRSDPRSEIHVSATLRAALRGSVALEFSGAAQQREKG